MSEVCEGFLNLGYASIFFFKTSFSRDLIEAADTIQKMKSSSLSVIDCVR